MFLQGKNRLEPPRRRLRLFSRAPRGTPAEDERSEDENNAPACVVGQRRSERRCFCRAKTDLNRPEGGCGFSPAPQGALRPRTNEVRTRTTHLRALWARGEVKGDVFAGQKPT